MGNEIRQNILPMYLRSEMRFEDGSVSYLYLDPEGRTGFLAYSKKKADEVFAELVRVKSMTEEQYERYLREAGK